MFSSAFLLFFNRLLESSPWAKERLLPFAGKSALFNIPPFSLGFIVATDGSAAPLSLKTDGDGIPDVVITLPSNTAFFILSGFDRVMSEAAVSGNAEFATELSFVMRNLRWDAEEDFAGFFGDIPAHRLFSTGKNLLTAQQEFVQRMAGNVTEYLTIESRSFASRVDLRSLAESIACLEADLQRLEKRVSALKS